MKKIGKVTLVGAGPGDPDLLTVKAVRAIETAEIIVHDRLVSREVLAYARKAVLVDVGKRPGDHPVPQEDIEALLIELALAGKDVVRLKGGDPFVFGRGYEEVEVLREAGISCTVVPGITAAQGAAASIEIPLTHRGLARSVRFITGHCREGEPLILDWAGLADPATTLVVYMGRGAIAGIAKRLVAHGLKPATPVLAIANATCADERRCLTSLATVAADIAAAELSGPVLFIIGDVAALARADMLSAVIDHAGETEQQPQHAGTVHV
ncbi:MAG: uroporphyrinogen-III C-methyltransferase [Hyphomicrobiales bacterium]|nr:uroporphyrinogen-III C-methyltransferase [Hyphomicrobiales bacterium]